MNAWGAVAIVVLFVGCAAPPPDPSDPQTRSSFSLQREGFLYVRAGADEPPSTQHEGDAPTFCFLVPPGTTRIEARFSWDVPQPMYLQFNPPGEPFAPALAKEGIEPPLVGVLEDPIPGEWFGYSGPSAVGGATRWSLHLAFEVRGLAGADDTTPQDDPCY